MEDLIYQMLKGKKRSETEHESLIYKTSLELSESYDIVFENDRLIPDLNMANRLYDAAVDLLSEVGIFCMETERVVDVSKDALRRSVRNAPSFFTTGTGPETTSIFCRHVLDERRPHIIGGPAGISISPELFIPVHRSCAKVNLVNAISPGSLSSLDTKPYIKENPLNIFEAQKGVNLVKEACRFQGRSGICCFTPPFVDDVKAAISIANSNFMGPGDLQEIFPMPSLKSDFGKLSRVVHYRGMGMYYAATTYMILGAMTSAIPEQFAIQIVADMLKSRYLYSAPMVYVHPSTLKTSASRSLEVLWSVFTAFMALSRNTNIIHGMTLENSSGPCTESSMYETAVQAIGATVCGADSLCGPVLNKGSAVNHAAGLESLFMGKVAEFATSLSLDDANYLCLELFNRYADQKPELGKSFDECYDVQKIQPTDEYYGIYDTAMHNIYDLIGARLGGI